MVSPVATVKFTVVLSAVGMVAEVTEEAREVGLGTRHTVKRQGRSEVTADPVRLMVGTVKFT